MQYKTCTKCGNELPATTEYFYKHPRGKYGVNSSCKICDREKACKWRLDNKELQKQMCADWEAQNKEYRKEYRKEWLKNNPNYHNKYYHNNTESRTKSSRGWRVRNIEHVKNYEKIYRQNNKDKINARKHKRKSKIKSLPATLTLTQWEQIKEIFNNQCAYCGISAEEHLQAHSRNMEQEHFVPLSKGGEYTHNNIIPACRSCNGSKQDKDFFEWYPQQPYYSKEREQKILDFLGYQQGIQQLTIAP